MTIEWAIAHLTGVFPGSRWGVYQYQDVSFPVLKGEFDVLVDGAKKGFTIEQTWRPDEGPEYIEDVVEAVMDYRTRIEGAGVWPGSYFYIDDEKFEILSIKFSKIDWEGVE